MRFKKWLGSYVHNCFIEGYPSVRRAVDKLMDRFALWCRSGNCYNANQFSPSRVVHANVDDLCVSCVGMQSHECAASSSLIRRLGNSSPVISGFRCNVAAEHATPSAWAQVTFSFCSSWETIHARACARVHVELGLCLRGHALYCASRCSFSVVVDFIVLVLSENHACFCMCAYVRTIIFLSLRAYVWVHFTNL